MPDVLRNPQAPGPPAATMDPQEQADRVQAVDAYATEDPQHFVAYGEACLEESKRANEELRRLWDECWQAYQLKRNQAMKEDWQSRIVSPEPLFIGQQAKAIIRKAFDRKDIYDLKGTEKTDEVKAKFYKAELDFQLNPMHANFALAFADACEMGFVTGQSMELLPRWVKQKNGTEGLTLDLIEPWKIFRDPDAKPRDPWSGLYWIHQEWMDKATLKQGEKRGAYQKIDEATSGGSGTDERDKDRRRKEQVHTSNAFRKYLLVNEFFGAVYDKQGEMLLEKTKYMFAGGSIIKPPVAVPYPTMPWPGTSFSPIPHLLRFEGRGLLEGVLSIWQTEDNLLNMTLDDLNWVVNRMLEIDPSLLMDGGQDAEVYPGKTWWKKVGTASAQAVREIVTHQGRTEILPFLQHLEQRRQNGSFVNPFVAGLPGTRSDITLGETEIKTRQSLGVFESIGTEVEAGAVWAIRAHLEVLAVSWTQFSHPSVAEALGPDAATFQGYALLTPEQRIQELRLNADITVRGISALLRRAEMLERMNVLMKRAENVIWQPYLIPYNMLKVEVDALGLGDDQVLKTEEQVQAEQQAALLAAQAAQPVAGGGLIPPGSPATSGAGVGQTLVAQAMKAANLQNGGP